ncbi:type II secretion system F family protein [Enterocloster lavalensis]|uniref:type II secretion system F family protein n=1 Tax=Enterocloster lavalensis TaxID=460384 RepID=UPI003AB9ADA8
MDYGVYTLTLREWFCYAAQGLAGCALAAYVFYRSAAAFLVMAPVGIFYPLYCREDLKRQRLRRLNLEFKDGILVLASFLSAGYSIENAVAASGRELTLLYGADGLMAGEFEEMARGLRLNRTVESVFLDLGGRSGLEDVNNFAQVFAAAKRSGGDLVEIISHTAGVIRDKVQVEEEIHTMTASKAFEQKIMSLVPVLIVLYIDLTSPGFFDIMYRTMAGRLVMSGCLAVYGISLLLARRILQVEI